MDIDAFINSNDQTLVYQCTYYPNPNRWDEVSIDVQKEINSLQWSDYIKYLDDNGKVSKELNQLPKDTGGFYLFIIQGVTLPHSERYLAYIGRAFYTEKENIRKRVKRYLWESTYKHGRPKIARLFRHWKNYLYIRYCPTQNNDLIEKGEATLIYAVLPPFNSDLPDKKVVFKEPQNAF